MLAQNSQGQRARAAGYAWLMDCALSTLAPRLTLLLALAPAFGCGSEEVPKPTEPASVGPIVLPSNQTLGGPSRPLDKTDGPRFSGVAAVAVGSTVCSGSFVAPPALDLAVDGPAYVLTAGHCLQSLDLEANTVLLDGALDPQHNSVTFRQFADSADRAVTVGAQRIAYSTVKGIDIGLVELASTRQQLRAEGIIPFLLANQPPSLDDPIVFAGYVLAVPAMGACRLRWRVPMLLEWKYHWYNVDADDCRDIGPGSSGSAMLSMSTGQVFGVMSTQATPDHQQALCSLNEPCEAGGDELRIVAGTSYSSPVSGLAACFDDSGRFDIQQPACRLDLGKQMQPSQPSIALLASPGGTLPLQLSLDSRGLTHYRYRIAPAGSDDCLGTAGYGPVVGWTDVSTIQATIPGDEGRLLVCLQAGSGADPSAPGWQDPTQPTVAIVEVYRVH